VWSSFAFCSQWIRVGFLATVRSELVKFLAPHRMVLLASDGSFTRVRSSRSRRVGFTNKVKVKVTLEQATEAQMGEEVQLYSFFSICSIESPTRCTYMDLYFFFIVLALHTYKTNTVHWVTAINVYCYAAPTCFGTYMPSSGSVFVLVSYVKTETAM
jgi:hypothetical protein